MKKVSLFFSASAFTFALVAAIASQASIFGVSATFKLNGTGACQSPRTTIESNCSISNPGTACHVLDDNDIQRNAYDPSTATACTTLFKQP